MNTRTVLLSAIAIDYSLLKFLKTVRVLSLHIFS